MGCGFSKDPPPLVWDEQLGCLRPFRKGFDEAALRDEQIWSKPFHYQGSFNNPLGLDHQPHQTQYHQSTGDFTPQGFHSQGFDSQGPNHLMGPKASQNDPQSSAQSTRLVGNYRTINGIADDDPQFYREGGPAGGHFAATSQGKNRWYQNQPTRRNSLDNVEGEESSRGGVKPMKDGNQNPLAGLGKENWAAPRGNARKSQMAPPTDYGTRRSSKRSRL